MRWMPQYFRPSEAKGLAFTVQYRLTDEGGGDWAMRVADEHCEVRPGTIDAPDLTVTMPAMLFLAVHRGEASPVLGVVTGRIRLQGRVVRGICCRQPGAFRIGRPVLHQRAAGVGQGARVGGLVVVGGIGVGHEQRGQPGQRELGHGEGAGAAHGQAVVTGEGLAGRIAEGISNVRLDIGGETVISFTASVGYASCGHDASGQGWNRRVEELFAQRFTIRRTRFAPYSAFDRRLMRLAGWSDRPTHAVEVLEMRRREKPG